MMKKFDNIMNHICGAMYGAYIGIMATLKSFIAIFALAYECGRVGFIETCEQVDEDENNNIVNRTIEML